MDNRFLIYNALDSAVTLEVRNNFWHELEAGFLPAYERTMRLFPVLMFMQGRGLRVNQQALKETQGEIEKSIWDKTEELHKVAGRALNPASPKDVASYFYIEKGVPPYTNKEGNITTDDLALTRLAKPTAKRPGFREARLIQEIRGLSKLKSSYLDVPVDTDGRLRCSWNPRGTKFGRLSSSKTIFETGMNLQNLHPQFKKFIWADEDYFFVEVDKRQAEWVLVAYLTQDANMLRVIEEGIDPHVFTATMIFHLDKEIIKLDDEVVGSETDPVRARELRESDPELRKYIEVLPRTFSARQVGKHANHGLNYDEGYVTFALYWELEQSFAKMVVNKYHQGYPGIRLWYKSVQNMLRNDRTLTNCFGRKMRFLDQWGDDLFKAAYSALPQSTQVDGLNQGMCDAYDDPWLCDIRGANADTMAQVHDSILFQFPVSILQKPGEFHRAMKLIYHHVSPEMEYHGRKFKIQTDMKIGYNWGASHKETNPKGMQKGTLLESPEEFEKRIRETLGVEQP